MPFCPPSSTRPSKVNCNGLTADEIAAHGGEIKSRIEHPASSIFWLVLLWLMTCDLCPFFLCVSPCSPWLIIYFGLWLMTCDLFLLTCALVTCDLCSCDLWLVPFDLCSCDLWLVTCALIFSVLSMCSFANIILQILLSRLKLIRGWIFFPYDFLLVTCDLPLRVYSCLFFFFWLLTCDFWLVSSCLP
jgi:hypothetical protein